jgi:hypothetical protein
MRRVRSQLNFIASYASEEFLEHDAKNTLNDYIKRDINVSSPMFYSENRGKKYREFEGKFGPIPDTVIELLNTKPITMRSAANVVKAVNRFKQADK